MRTIERTLPQDEVIKQFVGYIGNHLYKDLRITDWPDKRPGSIRGIDAVAESLVRKVAIEHTSVDYFPDQRLHDARFTEVVGGLEHELQQNMNSRVAISSPFGAVPTGTSWKKMRSALRNWIIDQVPLLPDGYGDHRIEGIPFPVYVYKSSDRPMGLFFTRSAKPDTDLDKRIRAQLNDKAAKLTKYHEAGFLTIVLIENADIANMSRGVMIKALESACPSGLPHAPDRVWYADTSSPGLHQFWNLTPSSRAKLPLMNAIEELERPPE